MASHSSARQALKFPPKSRGKTLKPPPKSRGEVIMSLVKKNNNDEHHPDDVSKMADELCDSLLADGIQLDDQDLADKSEQPVVIKPPFLQLDEAEMSEIFSGDHVIVHDLVDQQGATGMDKNNAEDPGDDCDTRSDAAQYDVVYPDSNPISYDDLEQQQQAAEIDVDDSIDDNIDHDAGPGVPESEDYAAETNAHTAEAIEGPRNSQYFTTKSTFTSREARTTKKQLREQGKTYLGIKKCDEERWNYKVPRPAKVMKPPCTCKAGRIGKKLKCRRFTETARDAIFHDFWAKKDWGEKRTLIASMVDWIAFQSEKSKGKRKKPKKTDHGLPFETGREDETNKYRKQMFLNTLAISDWFVLSCVKSENDGDSDSDQGRYDQDDNGQDDPAPSTSKTSPKARMSPSTRAKMEGLRSFLAGLPRMESHYCRKNTTKQFLEPIFQTKTEVFNLYKAYSSERTLPFATLKTFYEEFDRLNLSIYTPRKDQCDTCVGHKAGNISKDVYDNHQQQKTLARSEMESDTQTEDDNTFVFTMDVQGVLLSPRLNASALYYKMKLCVHNFTIFNNKTKDVKCFLWHKGQGGVSSNEFASIITNFISGLQLQPGNEVVLWSDNCTYQNRNVNLSNALLHLSLELQITIVQKYLQRGHTQMKCDSIHALIERRLKSKVIYTPAQYIDIIENARKGSHPYVVEYLEYSFFKDFSRLGPFTSIRPGYKTGDPTVSDLKAIKYTPEGELWYELDFTENWVQLERRAKKSSVRVPSQLLKVPPNISPDKFRHLQELKAVIPSDFHAFYDNLAH